MTIYKKYEKAYEILKNGCPDYSGENPIENIHSRFISEYSWNVERIGYFNALVEWLQGLALDIPFYNHDIMETFGLEESQLEHYWRFMAMRLNELFESRGLV